VNESAVTPLESKTLVDVDTGEIYAAGVSKKGGRYAMPGGYGVVSLVYISRMLEMKLGSGLEVALHLMSKADYGGLCMEKNEDIAKALGMTKTYVSTLIGNLHRKGVLHRVGPRTVFMNPAFFFRGTPQDQEKALCRWAIYRRSLISKAKAA